MSISIWRYSHFLLALASTLFLVIASVTGIILAFEPISNTTQSYHKVALNEVNLAESMTVLNKQYDEVLSIEVDANDFVLADLITKEGESEKIFINPITGENLGTPKEKNALFQWATNLHRSLFLKSIGRFFVGLISFLLCLITITGFFLLAKRQGGITKIFSKIREEYFEQRYHVILGRWFLLPILIVAATGVFLSLEKFSLLPSDDLKHETISVAKNTIPENLSQELPIFQNTSLADVRSLSFPFSDAPEDYFELSLEDRELYIDQYSGEVLSEAEYPFVTFASRFSLTLHTGQGSILWSLILLFSSASLLFFMYSGFVMTLKRRKKTPTTVSQLDKDECEYILLVGSETGTTNNFATLFQNALTATRKTVYKTELNSYESYKKAKHIIIFTATYGEGDAPTNARNFKKIFESVKVSQPIRYCVLGFGSLVYPDYCKFAIEVDTILAMNSSFKSVVPIYKINNQSIEAFQYWVSQWSHATSISLAIKIPNKVQKPVKAKAFKVIDKTESNGDNTFLIRLRPEKKIKFQSGDLWAYQPAETTIPRLYSIARMDTDILLSIKKHEFGVCSTLLSALSKGDFIDAAIQRNHEFHFPKHAEEIICIANGTGIAPFLGIIDENKNSIPIHLFWGGRTKSSFTDYKKIIDYALVSKKLSGINIAYSQEYNEKIYVQDLISEMHEFIAEKLKSGAVFMICGSVSMQNQVLDVFEHIAGKTLNTTLSEFKHKEQLKMDCY